ncbi:RNA polymerase sigma factor [Sporosarcina soli]|uniref:RNA polymerase sigma factor n=1 Tax=Sporosarcina soli TaxID=334736 RepID=A0ABW0TST4_9BACL
MGDMNECWMDHYCAKIELLAIQTGCTQQQAAKVTEETFRHMVAESENVTDEDGLKERFYRVALENLPSLQRTDSEEAILPFEEDREMHAVILQLDREAKLSFILSRFHHMKDGEIATIVGIPEEAVKEQITQAMDQLASGIGIPLIDKRLAYLEKSYERIRLSFRKDQFFTPPKQEGQKPVRKKKRSLKKILLSWGIGLIALAAIIIIPVVTGDEYQKASGEKYIEQLKESFEEEIASRYEQLGLKESTEEDHQNFHITEYGKQARRDFETMMENEEARLSETGRIQKRNVKKQYNGIIAQLALPSEMVEQLFEKPLTDDKEQSEKFIVAYMKRIFDIQQSYLDLFFEYEHFIEDATVDGTVQIEQYLANKESYPEELQHALKNMEAQNLYLTSIPQWTNVVPTFASNELSKQIKASLHPDLMGYITFLQSSNLIPMPKSNRSYKEKMHDLFEIEHTLLANDEIELPYMSLRDYYSSLFYGMITDSETNRIIGPDGKITEEVRTAWKKIASGGEESPSAHVMRNIIREMEASGWTQSDTQSRFTAYHLNYVMGLAMVGKLHTFEMKGILQPDQGFDIITFPDPSFDQLVEDTYRLFTANYDLAVLKDVHPFVIFGMYHLANDREDPVTMWHLYTPTDNPQPLEVYLADWEQENFQLDEVDGLLWDSSDGSIAWLREEIGHFYVDLEEDKNAGWKITSIYRDWEEIEE